MLAACVAGTSVVPVAASDVSVFSDGTDAAPEAFDSVDVGSATVATTKTVKINFYCPDEKKQIAEPELEVAKDATSVNTSKLTVPEGYELVENGFVSTDKFDKDADRDQEYVVKFKAKVVDIPSFDPTKPSSNDNLKPTPGVTPIDPNNPDGPTYLKYGRP